MKVPRTALRSVIALAIGVGLSVATPGSFANAQGSIAVVNPTGGSTSSTDSGLSQTQLDKDWAYARAHLAASSTVWSAKAMRATLGAQSVSDVDLKAAAATASPDEGWTITVDAQLNPVTASRTPKLMTVSAITVTNQCPSGYSCAVPTTPYAYTGFTGTGTVTGNWPGKISAESHNYLITFCTNAGIQAACSPKYPKNSQINLGGTKTVVGWGNFSS